MSEVHEDGDLTSHNVPIDMSTEGHVDSNSSQRRKAERLHSAALAVLAARLFDEKVPLRKKVCLIMSFNIC